MIVRLLRWIYVYIVVIMALFAFMSISRFFTEPYMDPVNRFGLISFMCLTYGLSSTPWFKSTFAAS